MSSWATPQGGGILEASDHKIIISPVQWVVMLLLLWPSHVMWGLLLLMLLLLLLSKVRRILSRER